MPVANPVPDTSATLTPRRLALRRRWYGNLPSPERVYLESLLRLCTPTSRVLDIGCGRFTPTLERLPKTCLRVGIDLVEDLQQTGPHVVRGNAERLPFANGSFDLICCRSVLEHVHDPQLLFREISRCLQPGGTFIFLTPNRWDYVSIVARIIPNRWHGTLVQWLTGRAPEDVFPTYYRANDASALRQLTSSSGLTLTSLTSLRQHPHYLGRYRWAYAVGILLEAVQQRVPAIRPWLLGAATR